MSWLIDFSNKPAELEMFSMSLLLLNDYTLGRSKQLKYNRNVTYVYHIVIG